MARSVVYAFLPVGSAPCDEAQYIRIGYHACKFSHGVQCKLRARFGGLNSVREILFMVEVESDKRGQVLDYLRMRLQGPGMAIGNTLRIEFHKTFKMQHDLGNSWYRTKLPVADVRAVFYEIADEICAGSVGHSNPQLLDRDEKCNAHVPNDDDTESNA